MLKRRHNQLDHGCTVAWLNGRALDLGSNGCRFESCRDRLAAHKVDTEGFEPSTSRMRNGRSSTELSAHVPDAHSKSPAVGIEPTTSGSGNRRASIAPRGLANHSA